jgi:O-antigen/teichoic acid export membrane protein
MWMPPMCGRKFGKVWNEKQEGTSRHLMATADTPKLSVSSAGSDARFSWITENWGSHVREYGGTFATEFTVLACQLMTYKLAAHFLGKTGFAEYAVARRTISLIYPVPLLGVAVALPRYVAHAIGGGKGNRKERYFGAAVWCMGLGLFSCVLLMNLLPGVFAYVFFAGRSYADLLFPLSILLVGLVLHTLAYSYFRGAQTMGRANVLQVVNYGIVPFVAFLFFRNNVRSVLTALGVLSTLVAGVALAFAPLRHAAEDVTSEAKDLLRYGVPRVPGDFVQMALLTLPVTFVAHFSGVQAAGYVAFGMSVLNMIGSLFSPLGLILLPKASRMLAAGDLGDLRSHVTQIVKITLWISVLLVVSLEFTAGQLIRLYLGPNFSEAAGFLRLLVLAAVPFSLYCVLRNLVDAFHQGAVNARNLVVAFVAFLALVLAGLLVFSPPVQILWAFVASIFLLAVLSHGEASRILAERPV